MHWQELSDWNSELPIVTDKDIYAEPSDDEQAIILFNDTERQNASAFVGIRLDHAEKPYCAVTIHGARRFKSARGAARWYAQETGLKMNDVLTVMEGANGQKEV